MPGSVLDRYDAERLGERRLDRLVHELRTPLAAIQSMADALGSGHFGRIENERHANYVESIAETARHALAVIETMLVHEQAMPSVDGEAVAGVDVAALARDVVAGMGMLAARAGIRLDVCGAAEAAVPAMARATDVRQMLINLVSNGIVHAGGGSTVRVATGADERMVWITVADDGKGIPQAIIDRLDQGLPLDAMADDAPASRMRLGLTLTRALADTNGGRLEIRSGTGGADVRVIFPAAPSRDAP